MRPDRVTTFVRDYWPQRPYMGSLIVGFALAGMAIGGAVGLLVGNGEGGVALGLTLGVFVGVTWVFIALVTRPRA